MARSPETRKAGTASPTQTVARRRRRRWPLVGLLLCGAAAAAPLAVERVSVLRNAAVRWLAPDLDGEIYVGDAHLRWWSPVTFRDVVVCDRSAEPIFEMAEIVSARSLWQLCADPGHAGAFRCVRPQAHVLIRAAGSNVEDLLAPVFRAPRQRSPQFSLDLEEGAISLRDAQTDREARWGNVNVQIESPGGSRNSWQISGTAADQEQAASSLSFKCRLRPATDKSEQGGDDLLSLKARALDLSHVAPLVRRMASGWSISGAADVDVQCNGRLGGEVPRCDATARLTATDLSLSIRGPRGIESLSLATFEASAEASLSDGRLQLRQLAVASDVVRSRLTAECEWPESGGAAAGNPVEGAGWPALFQSLDVEGDLEIELAPLASAFPATLHFREGVRVSRGTVRAEISTQKEATRRGWQSTVRLVDLVARVDNRPIAWEPVEATITAHATTDGPEVDALRCRTKFIDLAADGSLAAGRLQARLNLDEFGKQFGQLIELSSQFLSGRAAVDAQWQWPATGEQKVDLRGVAERVSLSLPGRRPWREDRVELSAALEGRAERAQRQIDSGQLTFTSGGDHLDVTLREPLLIGPKVASGAARMRLAGDLATWLARLPLELVPAGLTVSGGVTAEGLVRLGEPSVACDDLRVDLERLDLRGDGWRFEEPLAKIEARGQWGRAAGRLELPSLTVASQSIALRGSDLVWQPGEPLPTAGGTVSFQADVARLATGLPRVSHAAPLLAGGIAKGRIRVAESNGLAQFSAEIASDDLALSESPQQSVGNRAEGRAAASRQTPARAVVAGTLDRRHDRLRLESAELAGDGLKLIARGGIENCSLRQVVDLVGELIYDWDRLSPFVRTFISPDLRLAGSGRHDWSLRGPLAVPRATAARSISRSATPTPPRVLRVADDLRAQAGLGWSSARLYGMSVGPAQLEGALKHGVVDFVPLDLAVGKGHLHLGPQLLLNHDPMLVSLTPGRVVEQLHVTPELCAGWLRYVAPLVAGATQAEGRFSVDLSEGAFPLADPGMGQAAGVLAIQGAQVLPAGFALNLIQVARQFESIIRRQPARGAKRDVEAILVFPEQEVPFALARGRVEHTGLTMQSGDVTIRTRGSVGLDETLSLVAEFPIPADWVARDRYLKGMQGQVVPVPIGGTLQRPQIDSRGLNTLAQKLAGSAAESAIEGVIEDQLKRLLPRGK
ncbi:MAG: hypothetical protein ACT4QC_18850 [Planctomycetaceae bacterium]